MGKKEHKKQKNKWTNNYKYKMLSNIQNKWFIVNLKLILNKINLLLIFLIKVVYIFFRFHTKIYNNELLVYYYNFCC